MAEETYVIDGDRLVIVDPELQIQLEAPFDLSLLPLELEGATHLESGEKVVLERDGEQKIVKAFLNCKGKMHGECRLFYPSGQSQAQMFYHENRLHGPSTFFSEQGAVLSKSWFCFGVQQGKARYFYLSGKTHSVQKYKDGKMHGKQEFFYEDGCPKTLMHYENGVLHGEVKLFWPHSLLKREICFVNGKRRGWDRIWSETQVLLSEEGYPDDSV